MESFREYVNAGAFNNTGAVMDTPQTFGIGKSNNLPTPTLEIPTRTFSGTISNILYNQDPILIRVKTQDKSYSWKVTKEQWNYLKKINRQPEVDKRVMIEMNLDGTIKSVSYF